MQFTKATKRKAKLRAALCGPAGSGKTFTALRLAHCLGGKVALIDSEHGSASKYADKFSFDSLELETFALEQYIEAISMAGRAGYGVLVVDSLSHAWTGKGGALETVDRLGGSNKFTNGWRQVTPLHNALVDAMLAYPGHVIATMRTKMEYLVEEINGKKVPRKVGLAPVQREGVEYEFDLVCDLDQQGTITVAKTRCDRLSRGAGLLRYEDTDKLGATLLEWLTDGTDAPAEQPHQSQQPTQPQQTAQTTQTQPATGPVEQALTYIASAKTGAELSALSGTIKELGVANNQAVRAAFGQRMKELKQ